MMDFFRRTFIIICILAVVCCSKISPYETETIIVNTDDPAYQKGVAVALKKANQLVNIKWTSQGVIPNTFAPESPYLYDHTYKGIPYSSVKEECKFIGMDVSFYTFLTAVQNPKSVLYTEIVNQAPYHGKNCASYYGIVCSTAIGYAIGLKAPYPSASYSTNPEMQKVTNCNSDLVEVGDILASRTHTIMAVDVERDNGAVKAVRFLENSSYIVKKREELENYWRRGYCLYRYSKMRENSFSEIEFPQGNMSICASRGDKSTYREGENVVINVLDDDYESVIIIKDSVEILRSPVTDGDVVLTGLKEGLYSVALIGNEIKSLPTQLEVVSANISIRKQGDLLTVFFIDNNVPPIYVELCDITGSHLYIKEIDEASFSSGEITIPIIECTEDLYCRAVFQGRYGRVASKKELIN